MVTFSNSVHKKLIARSYNMMYITNNFFLSFLQVKIKPLYRGKYAFILKQDAVANIRMSIQKRIGMYFHTMLKNLKGL